MAFFRCTENRNGGCLNTIVRWSSSASLLAVSSPLQMSATEEGSSCSHSLSFLPSSSPPLTVTELPHVPFVSAWLFLSHTHSIHWLEVSIGEWQWNIIQTHQQGVGMIVTADHFHITNPSLQKWLQVLSCQDNSLLLRCAWGWLHGYVGVWYHPSLVICFILGHYSCIPTHPTSSMKPFYTFSLGHFSYC